MVGGRVGLVDADGERGIGLKSPDQHIGQTPVVIEDDPHLPGARAAKKYRRIGMDGYERGRQPCRFSARQGSIDRLMIGNMNEVEPARALLLAQAAIGLDLPALAHLDDETVGIDGAIAVDYETRDIRPDERRIQLPRQEARDPKRAGIPSDMRKERIFLECEGRKLVGDAIGRVIANDHVASLAFRVFRNNRAANQLRYLPPRRPLAIYAR